jgi:hypothetical protein
MGAKGKDLPPIAAVPLPKRLITALKKLSRADEAHSR